jgi:23S rRNA (cytidine1920-2'-O)/16S rRNA (cytidine1409-2'-O)-methyltransferase
MERTNARYLKAENFPEKPEITVMDVSFISIRLILPTAAEIMGEDGVFYTLIKPQFEAGRGKVGKKGVVREAETHLEVLEGIAGFTETFGWRCVRMDFSPITGPEGNIEFLAEIAPKAPGDTMIDRTFIRSLVSQAHEKLYHSDSTQE